MLTTQELENLKEQIEEAKTNKAKAEGNIEQIEKTWKEDYNINSVEEAEKFVADTEKEIKEMEEKLDKYTGEIKEAMEGNND